MLLKPGWIIAIMLFWLLTQFLITTGNAINYNADTFGDYDDTTTGKVIVDGIGDAKASPILSLITTAQTIIKNPLTAVITVDWASVIVNMWKMFTFQTNFLTGAWNIISIILACFYSGFGLSILYNLV
jgi:hypothetical protein